MTPVVRLQQLNEPSEPVPVLVVGPSIGTSVLAVWAGVAREVGAALAVWGWDLPGHGDAPTGDPFTVADLADGVAAAIEDLDASEVHYAGDSLGAAVGLQLALDRPDLLASLSVCCTAARIGTRESWLERARDIRAHGTNSLVDASGQRWFAPGFADRRPDIAQPLLQSLRDADDESYAQACEALAVFDVREELADLRTPLLAVAGEHDHVTTVRDLRAIADGVHDGRLAVITDAAHLAPAERPETVARLVTEHALRPRTDSALRDAGMAVRREVLGDAHVDRAGGGRLGKEFQDLITRYAWGSIWTRPGLARRDRSLITLTALVALGHDEELALHLRAARRNGVTEEEIVETLLQTAIYCGVPAANTAFRIAEQVLGEADS